MEPLIARGEPGPTPVSFAAHEGAGRVPPPPANRLTIAYGTLLLFIVVYFGRPGDWIPGALSFPFAKIVGVAALLSFALSVLGGRVLSKMPKEVILLGALFGYLCLTVPFAVCRSCSLRVLTDRFLKVVLITVVMTFAVNSVLRLRKLILVQTASMTVMAVFCVRGYEGGRASGVGYGDFSNPNDFALTVVTALPFALMFFLSERNALRRAIWGGVFALLTYVVIISYSRAGFLALVCTLLVCFREFGDALKRRPLLMAVAVLAVLGLFLTAPGDYVERMSTILEPSEDVTGSSQSREHLLRRSIALTFENPLFGLGPGNFSGYTGLWRETHNTYTQFSSEGGIPALVLFLWLIVRAFKNLRRARDSSNRWSSLSLMAGATRASLTGFLVGAFFASLAFHFYPYFLLGYSTALVRASDSAPAAGARIEDVADRADGAWDLANAGAE